MKITTDIKKLNFYYAYQLQCHPKFDFKNSPKFDFKNLNESDRRLIKN
jgi:hypothetical protein